MDDENTTDYERIAEKIIARLEAENKRLQEGFIDELIGWIVREIGAYVVPRDEGNEDALIYNLVQLARYGKDAKYYNYLPEQDEEIDALYKKYGREV